MFSGLFKAAGAGINLARSEAKAAVQRAVQKAIFVALGVFLLLLAFGFGLGAFTVWLAREIGTIQALGFIALGFVVLAVIVYIVARYSGDRPAKKRSEPSPIAAALRSDPLADNDEDAPPGSALGSLAVVSLIGFLMAKQMFRR